MLMDSGWLVLNKPPNATSFEVTRQVGRIMGQKTGHGGTLDPFASGVLPIGVGNEACKCLSYILESDKVYQFTIAWCIETDTLDITGKPMVYNGRVPEKEDLLKVLSKFTREMMQVPPLFSAIKKNGVPYYRRARAGETASPPPRKVKVNFLKLLEHSPARGESSFELGCSKGFYVRALARDLAREMNTVGLVKELKRISAGPFHLKDGICLKEVTEHTAPLPIDYPFRNMDRIQVTPAQAEKLRNGVFLPWGCPPRSFTIYLDNSMIGFGVRKRNAVFPSRILSRG